MKSLAEQMRNHDREQMSRMAHNLPEQYQERAPVEQVAQVFNKLFNELRAAFPASMANFRTQEDLNEFRRQWLLAFQENGIHSMPVCALPAARSVHSCRRRASSSPGANRVAARWVSPLNR